MVYRQHRSHARYAAVIAPAIRPRRMAAARSVGFAPLPKPEQIRSGALVGLLYALPLAILLWAAIVLAIRSVL